MRTAMVLSGGGAKGAFHVGAIEAILKKKVPDAIFGVSVGAYNGAILLSMKDLWEGTALLKDIWLDADKDMFFTSNSLSFLNANKMDSLFSHDGLKLSLNKFLKVKRFENTLLPFYVKCTRLLDGKAVYFNKGSMINPIIASCSVPPMFSPVKIKGVEYIDGGIEGSGLKKVESMGFDQIILLNLNTPTKTIMDRSINSFFSVCLENLVYNLTKYEISDIKKSRIIEIDIDPKYSLDFLDFGCTQELIKLGQKKAKEKLFQIKKLYNSESSSHFWSI
jgi:NTE family protein